MRILHKIVVGFPEPLIREVSPKHAAANGLRNIVKLPMILILSACGVAAGLNLTAFTFLGEMWQSKSLFDAPGLLCMFISFATSS